VNGFERRVRAHVMWSLRDTAAAPSIPDIASALGATADEVRAALQALHAAHRLVLRPGGDAVWMAHPFSAVPTDVVVRIGDRRWYANCVWDGLSILALLGDGTLETHSPATGAPITLVVHGGRVTGEAIVHFLVPARAFWDDIGFT